MSLIIDGGIFRRMILSAAASLQMQKQHINELNVFPVPDGDTGTNMCMTLGAAVRLLQQPKQMDVGGWQAARPPRCCGMPEATPALSYRCCSGA